MMPINYRKGKQLTKQRFDFDAKLEPFLPTLSN